MRAHPIGVMTTVRARRQTAIPAVHPGALIRRKDSRMPTFLWILLAAAYLAALVSLGVRTLRKRHTVLFVVGIIFPILWIIGALISPTPRPASGSLTS
jgi:hypothetical protein